MQAPFEFFQAQSPPTVKFDVSDKQYYNKLSEDLFMNQETLFQKDFDLNCFLRESE